MFSHDYCIPTVLFDALDPTPTLARVTKPLGHRTEKNAVD